MDDCARRLNAYKKCIVRKCGHRVDPQTVAARPRPSRSVLGRVGKARGTTPCRSLNPEVASLYALVLVAKRHFHRTDTFTVICMVCSHTRSQPTQSLPEQGVSKISASRCGSWFLIHHQTRCCIDGAQHCDKVPTGRSASCKIRKSKASLCRHKQENRNGSNPGGSKAFNAGDEIRSRSITYIPHRYGSSLRSICWYVRISVDAADV